jgi:hypothetical protein
MKKKEILQDGHKRCRICGKVLPYSAFYRMRKAPDGRHYYCKKCSARKCKEWKAKNWDRMLSHGRKWNAANAHKKKAHNEYAAAVRAGKINIPECCEKCGATERLEAHHSDYEKPLDVVHLCRQCHEREHHED